jgi:hypothetical protein
MRTWLVRLTLAVALLPLVVQCAWWAASYRWGGLAVLYTFGGDHADHAVVSADRGVWRVHRFRSYALEGANWSSHFVGPLQLGNSHNRGRYGPEEPNTWRELLWPAFERGVKRGRYPEWYLTIPAGWTVGLNLVPVAVCAGALVRGRRRRARVRRGLCAACGYDLRGGHARCPECGRGTQDVARATSP